MIPVMATAARTIGTYALRYLGITKLANGARKLLGGGSDGRGDGADSASEEKRAAERRAKQLQSANDNVNMATGLLFLSPLLPTLLGGVGSVLGSATRAVTNGADALLRDAFGDAGRAETEGRPTVQAPARSDDVARSPRQDRGRSLVDDY